jgi:lipopolysaccharide/colanic/teichoic acid biosynthesis glycosyltransferase
MSSVVASHTTIVQKAASSLVKASEGVYPPARNSFAVLKRGFDLVATSLAAPVAVLIIAAAALAILITCGRPVFFVQERVGKGGRIFRMYKLRTMSPRTPGKDVATAVGDARITPLGAILRQYRIDELPHWPTCFGETCP